MLKRISIIITVLFVFACLLNGCSSEDQLNNPDIWTQIHNQLDPADSNNFWDALRADFSLNHHAERREVQEEIRWFMRNQHYLQRITQRAAPYLYYILQQVKKRHLPGEIVLMPIIESAYDPFAHSVKGAVGLWQIMPTLANDYGIKNNWWINGRRDIFSSTNAALDYMQYLYKFFNGNWLLAMAAYDSGQGTILNAIRRNRHHGLATDYWSLRVSRETRDYVPKLLAIAIIISHPEKYHVKLPAIANAPYFTVVNVGSQIDLTHAARMAGISINDIYMLNPEYNQWATNPKGSHQLLLPIANAKRFKAALLELPKNKRVKWARHTVRFGDTLSTIAHRYGTTVYAIKTINKLHSHIIKIGQTLFVPNHKHVSFLHREFERLKAFYHSPKHLYFTPPPKYLKIIHQVKSGESLWLIAKRYRMSIAALKHWNHLKNDIVHVGTKLVMYRRLHHHERAAYHRKTMITYYVKPGDNLSLIAKRYHLKVSTLKKFNALHSNRLRIKQKLLIPRHHS